MYKDTVYCDVQRYSVLRCTKIKGYWVVQRYSALRCTKLQCIAMYKDTVYCDWHCDVQRLKGVAMYKDTVYCDAQGNSVLRCT